MASNSAEPTETRARLIGRLGGKALALLVVAAIVAIIVPIQGGAWPWDDDRHITVRGDVVCDGFDSSLSSRNPVPRVEGFEIRGRSHVLRKNGNGTLATYEVSVPPGWVVEWSMKCSNSSSWEEGSFEVTKTYAGSSYEQIRHVCNNGGLSTCQARNIGGCVLVMLQGPTFGLPREVSFEQAIDTFMELYGPSGGPTDEEACLRALRDSLPQLNTGTPPDPTPTVPTIPNPPSTLGTVPTIPDPPPTLPPATQPPATQPPVTQPPVTQPPKPTATGLVVVIYGAGHVGVAFEVGWQAGRDPVVCHFFRDGVEVFTAQCGTHSSKQFYGVPVGTHTFYATVSDRFGVYSDPTPTITKNVT